MHVETTLLINATGRFACKMATAKPKIIFLPKMLLAIHGLILGLFYNSSINNMNDL